MTIDSEIPTITKGSTLQQLEAGLSLLLESTRWQKYLLSQSLTNNYSPRNCILIKLACPTATKVAGYHAWKKLNRYVRKGERGIKIYAPSPKKVRENGAFKSVIDGFRPVYVFDISQTSGEDLVTITKPLVGDDKGLLNSLIKLAYSRDISVTFEHCDSQGFYRFDKDNKLHLININPDYSSLQMAHTMSHELAHYLLHDPRESLKHLAVRELEAESVAYVVLDYFGLDCSDYSFEYIAHWQYSEGANKDSALIQLKKSAEAILKASDTIINFLNHQKTHGMSIGDSYPGV